jgi:hypothetical protein
MHLALFEVEDQHAKLHVCGIQCDEFTRVGQRGRKITGLSRNRHKGEECVPIRRMAWRQTPLVWLQTAAQRIWEATSNS